MCDWFGDLYKNLKYEAEMRGDIKIDEYKELIENVKNLDNIGYELIFRIINKHYIDTNSKVDDMPYNGVKIESNVYNINNSIYDVKFDIRNFPSLLRRMLLEFSRKHLNKIKEEKTYKN